MQRIVYIAWAEYDDCSDGVVKKIKMQIAGMKQNDAEVVCIAYGEEGLGVFEEERLICSEHYKKGPRRFQLLSFAEKYLADNNTDVLYIRFAYSEPVTCLFLRKVRKYVKKIIVELPTYPYWYKGTFRNDKKLWLQYVVDYITLPWMSKYVSRYYVVGKPVESLYGVKAKNIPNGIVESGFKTKKHTMSEEINILCLATMYVYQGYDRIIRGLRQYKDKGGTRKIVIHIVGDGPELQTYKDIVKETCMEESIIFYGQLSGTMLDDLFDICDVACSTLAPHRKKIVYASPLKSKEYMLRGIPYLYAYNEIGIDEQFPYLLQISSDETPVDMWVVEQFFDSYKDKKQEVAKCLQQYAIEHFSWKNLLKDIME